MKKEVKSFIKICKKDKASLKSWLFNKLKEYGYTPKAADGYLLAVGSKIMLTAHMDTVHKELVKSVVIENHEDKTIISSPQGIGGDDRCGVYMILTLLDRGYRPTILFCEDEEIGGVGSGKFVETNDAEILNDMLYLLELDRKGSVDAVYYSCGNKDFQQYVESFGFTKDHGSFSDIGNLSPAGDVASVNLSCGYYKQHTTDEYVVFEEMMTTIDKVGKMLDDEGNVKDKYDYQEEKFSFYGGKYRGLYDYDDYDYWGGYYGSYKSYERDFYQVMWFHQDIEVPIISEYSVTSELEAIGAFLKDHPDMTYKDIFDVCIDDTFWETYGEMDVIYEDDIEWYEEELLEEEAAEETGKEVESETFQSA